MKIIKVPPREVLIGISGVNLPKPFEREIFLFDTYIAGTTHIENIKDLVLNFKENEVFHFLREPDNEYDKKAIIIKNINKEKIGYIPEVDNIVISRLMDAGKLIIGKLKKVKEKGQWQKIYIDIYLKD